MNGKTTFQKSLERSRRSQGNKTANKTSMEVGNWRFEENEDGDLVVINIETQETTILIEKQAADSLRKE